MKREFFDTQIPQRTKDSFFNATELLKFYNDKTKQSRRFKDFWKNKNTVEFCEALKNELLTNRDNSPHLEIFETQRGNKGSTWMHPYLFVKFAFWLSPEYEVKVIKWIYDNLIDFRNQAGDHYKEMCKTIQETYHKWFDKNPDPLIYVNEAKFLNLLVFGNEKSKQRNKANELQLNLMNELQLLNIQLIKKDVGKTKRHERLTNHVFNYQMINSGSMSLITKERN
jgi:hypothetical protein